MSMDWVVAKWKAPTWVQAFTTSRNGGHSRGTFRSLNLSYDVGDFKETVDMNRDELTAYTGRRVPFLQLQHGVEVIEVTEDYPTNLQADAAIIRKPGHIIGILTADCLPIFFSNANGSIAAIAHAGWRGLAGGIIENVVAKMGVPPAKLTAFIGPSIHAYSYYVGKDVFDAFMQLDPDLRQCFKRADNPDQPGKVHCDLVRIALHRLNKLGVVGALANGADTFRDVDDFFSYRRDGATGRMASVIHILRDNDEPVVAPKNQASQAPPASTPAAPKNKSLSVDFELDL